MDEALRILHVVLGIFWAGSAIFADFILLPQLKKLGPNIERPVVKQVLRVSSPVMTACSLLVLGTGIAMVLRTQMTIGVLVSTAWGIAMVIAFVAIVISLVLGLGVLTPTGLRMEKLGKSMESRKPDPGEIELMGRLTRRVTNALRTETFMIIIAIVMMPLSRFL